MRRLNAVVSSTTVGLDRSAWLEERKKGIGSSDAASAVGLCVAAAMASGRELFLDVAIGVALVGFVATVAWARMIDGRADSARRQP